MLVPAPFPRATSLGSLKMIVLLCLVCITYQARESQSLNDASNSLNSGSGSDVTEGSKIVTDSDDLMSGVSFARPHDKETRERFRKLHGIAASVETSIEFTGQAGANLRNTVPLADTISSQIIGFVNTQADMDAIQSPSNLADFPNVIQPISIINFVKSDGTGRVSYNQVMQQINQLNRAYSGQEAQNGGYSGATDSKIRFKLSGIRYVVNDDYFNLCTLPTTIAAVRPKYMMNGAINLNIYICWCQNDLGLGWLPYQSWFGQGIAEGHYARGATVHWDLLPGNSFNGGLWSKGNIMTHEIGHTFGLLHPYQGDCTGSELDSDQVDDTPRMTGNPLLPCGSVKPKDSCPSLPGTDDLSNYMVATADSCRNHFTKGQVAYMHAVIRQFKPTLLKQLLPNCVAAVDSSDASPDLQPCLDGTLATSVDGRQFCLTDPTDSTVWAWACCPSDYNWDSQACWQGTPDFTVPADSPAVPAHKGGDNSSSSGSLTNAPTNGGTQTPTVRPSKSPTKYHSKRPTKTPTKRPTKRPTTAPTRRPTKTPTVRKTRSPTATGAAAAHKRHRHRAG